MKAFAPNTEFWRPLGMTRKRAFLNATAEPLAGRSAQGFRSWLRRGIWGLWAVSPQVQGGARRNCAQSHQDLCPGAWSAPSAQPKAEVWRREVKGGEAPCTDEGAALPSRLQGSRAFI